MDKFDIKGNYENYKKYFLEENAKHNLISKNDEQFLYEKHIYDSLSIKLFFDKYKICPKTILDIGCGGGFPCLPIAIEFPQIQVTGIDSIGKKINSIETIKNKLNLKNLNTICGRVENLKGKKFDVITARAVADLSKIAAYAIPLLSSHGYFVAYKSQKAKEEINNAEEILQKYNAKVDEVIEYTLPLEECYTRNLIIISKK